MGSIGSEVTYTFATEEYAGSLWLCTQDAHGEIKRIAEFRCVEAMRSFWDVLNLSKMAAHAHGSGGI